MRELTQKFRDAFKDSNYDVQDIDIMIELMDIILEILDIIHYKDGDTIQLIQSFVLATENLDSDTVKELFDNKILSMLYYLDNEYGEEIIYNTVDKCSEILMHVENKIFNIPFMKYIKSNIVELFSPEVINTIYESINRNVFMRINKSHKLLIIDS